MMGYEPELFTDEQRHPTLEELDNAIAPDHRCIACMAAGISACNTKAMAYLGITDPSDAEKVPGG